MPILCCPICQKKFDTETAAAMPFCCDRCRQIDLGRWLHEGYGVPFERNPDLDGDGEGEQEYRREVDQDDES